jgi:glucose-1-phosphate thymidylyltransferase
MADGMGVFRERGWSFLGSLQEENILKGLILSGGEGTRLRPITHTSAKQLIPVANKPVLFYGLEAIKEAGITEVGIIVGETRQEIRKEVGDGSRWGLEISYIHQEAPLGLAHAVLTAEAFIGEESFVMYLGDNIIKHGIKDLVNEFRDQRPNAQILLARVPNPSQFGVAELKGRKVVRLEEKPKEPKSDLALVGVYMFDANIFKAAKAIKPSWRNELEITDAIQWLIDHGHEVSPHIVTGWWKDTGRLEDVLEANRLILDTIEERVEGDVDDGSDIQFKVIIEKGAKIRNSVIRGPAIIGGETSIRNAYVGPFTSIYSNCRIENVEIQHSIVCENTVIKDQPSQRTFRIEDSLIGKNVEITRTDQKPKAHRLLLGDSSKVELL